MQVVNKFEIVSFNGCRCNFWDYDDDKGSLLLAFPLLSVFRRKNLYKVHFGPNVDGFRGINRV